MKYNDNGTYKDIYVKTFDTLPVGAELDYDGERVPSGYVQVADADAITIKLSSPGQNITTSTPAYSLNLIKLDNEFVKIGTKLTFNSTNNSIVIGAGVHHVEVSANANIRNSNSSALGERIIAPILVSNGNNTVMGQSGYRGTISTASNTNNITLSIAPFIYQVSENDEIKLEFASENFETITIYGSNACITYLTVKVID